MYDYSTKMLRTVTVGFICLRCMLRMLSLRSYRRKLPCLFRLSHLLDSLCEVIGCQDDWLYVWNR